MTRGQVVVLVLFLALVGGFAALVLPELVRNKRSLGEPARPPPPGARALAPPGSRSGETSPRATEAGPAAARGTDAPLTLRVRTADGAVVPPSTLRIHGLRVVRRSDDSVDVLRPVADAWVGAPGRRWAKVARGASPVEIRLVDAASAIEVTVVEASGGPAGGVPVGWPGPDGRPLARRTNAAGRVVIDDQPAGLLIVAVGGSEWAGPTLRLRAGVDREARAVLDPPLVVRGRVRSTSDAGRGGVVVRGVVPDGRAGRDVLSSPDGRFVWAGRATDRLVLVAGAGVEGAVAIEPPRPDPLGPLSVDADIVVSGPREDVHVRVDRRHVGDAHVVVRAEPTALALVREAFGPGDVAYEAFQRDADAPVVKATGPGLEGPVRVQVDGDVVPEDHLVGLSARTVDVVPRKRPPEPPSAAAPTPSAAAAAATAATATAAVSGRVVDADARPLPGVTVIAGRDRAVTAADGRFAIEGRAAGERVAILYGWLDGAVADPIDPRPFASWFHGVARAGAEGGDFVLPRSAAVSFRATQGLDGRPLSWVRVVVVDGAGEPLFDDVRATRNGDVVLEGLVPGTPGTLTLLAPGLRRDARLALRAGETVALGEVALVRGGRVEGTVRDGAGAAVAGASVAAIDDGRGESRDALARDRELFLRTATTDATGAFSIEGLDPARAATLSIYARGFAPTLRRAEPEATGFTKVAATLVPGAAVRIRVVDEKDQPLAGAAVELRDARTGVRWLELWRRAGWGGVVGSSEDIARATTALVTEDPTVPGRHRVGPLEPGPYDVVIERPGYRAARARYSVADPSPRGADNPLGLPLDTMEWRVALEPEPSTAR